MSLAVDGVWKAGVWAPTVWAAGVWSEGQPIPPAPVVVAVAVDHDAGPASGPIQRPPDDPYIDLSDDTDESEVAQIAALVIRYFS